MHLEQAERKRDLRLRRRILQLLHAARVRPEYGWADGRFVFDLVNGASPGRNQQIQDDAHCLGLLRDLVDSDYVEQRDDRQRKSQPAGLDFTSYRITALGTALIEEQIDPDPLVDDDRVVKSRQ
jgi:hypothetical protein